MAELHHFSHECPLTSPKMVADGICSICFKDEMVELACSPCNFNLCKACFELPQMVSHDFHPDHPLEFCLHQYDQKPGHIVCSGCGNMSSCSFYKCQDCEIYLDLDCALQGNIFRSWDAKKLLHDSHCHLLRRCRPGPDAKGFCLLCELSLSPSTICYGCVYCYSFVHERCIDLPREIQHPVHPAHPLKRLDYTRKSRCDVCGKAIASVPFGCQECDFDVHFRCLDSVLRSLMHKSHQHKLIYRTNARGYFTEENPCQICMRGSVIFLDSFFYCMECGLIFHLECLDIPEYVVKKSHHIHPLVCKLLPIDNDFLEYCGVCETMVYTGHHAYSCEECDFLGHIECILREEAPSPLYVKDLYSFNKENMRAIDQGEHETNDIETKLTVDNMNGHIHVMKFIDLWELDDRKKCNICGKKIHGNPCKCETCSFQTHNFCAELGRPLKHRVHRKHALLLLPKPPAPAEVTMKCDICTYDIKEFNLFCRICNFIIHTTCIYKGKHMFVESQRGQKIIGSSRERCIQNKHFLVKVMVSTSYVMACAICDERVSGKVLSCMKCGDIYHPLCTEVGRQRIYSHPLHPHHGLGISLVSGSKCIACQLNITKYGCHCSICEISFHMRCIKAVRLPKNIKSHRHCFYNFWISDSRRVTRTCRVCAKPCGVSFYSCIDCDFNAHAECIGFPSNVKNQQHQHTLAQDHRVFGGTCSLCGSRFSKDIYSCKHCMDEFHFKCIMSTDDRDAATEEKQLGDIYLMYIERDLLHLLENRGGMDSDDVIEDSDSSYDFPSTN
ncbi:unnamed protein product [Arabis nemorensis]|uniref:Phorbol-ester/DAG-type domain-containing protein n=1 Tax=Arabis nemorensis TaxID=586526 RepID=A0A565BMK5_9BRAS|nr:unnamed protein product [Arabis nemorensis]